MISLDQYKLSVRWMTASDVESVLSYWYDSPIEDLFRMGVNVENLPKREQMREVLAKDIGIPGANSTAAYSIWCLNEKSIGFSSLKDVIPGERGGMHLHMWNAGVRGKGFGSVLFCLSALEFHKAFQLRNIVCEPSSKNHMPNRMLQKIGFPLLRTFIGKSSALSATTELNTYDIRKEIAETFLIGISKEQSFIKNWR